jgi:hypothetical protein
VEAQRVLASSVWTFWETEAAKREITTPATVRVTWRFAKGVPAASLADVARLPLDEAMIAGDSSVSPQPKPQLLTEGALGSIYRLYTGLPNRQLVIVGEPGTGKTGALILLLLTACRATSRSLRGEAIEPVPVLVPLTGWNPLSMGLLRWVELILRRDHQYLKSRDYGTSAARTLLASGRVALFLDGLDEMPRHLRGAAIRHISRIRNIRIVLTSRTAEYSAASAAGHLPQAAVIELSPVDAVVAADYLEEGRTESERQAWQCVTSQLRRSPQSALAQALDRPLTLTLVRSTYPPGTAPDELLDTSRFPTPASIKTRLLELVLPRAFDRLELELAAETLKWIAFQTRERGTRDIEWWRLRRWIRPTTSVLLTVLTASISAGVSTALAKSAAMGWVAGLSLFGTGAPTAHYLYTIILGKVQGPLRGLLPRMAVAVSGGGLTLGPVLLYLFAKSPATGAAQAIVFAGVVGVFAGVAASLIALHDTPLQAHIKMPGVGEAVVANAAGLAGGGVVFFFASFQAALIIFALIILGVVLTLAWTRPAAVPTEELTPSHSYRGDLFGGLLAAGMGSMWAFLLCLYLLRQVPGSSAIYTSLALSLTTFVFSFMLLTQSGSLLATALCLRFSFRAPIRVMKFLDRAAQLQVLRQVGAVYQFRHGEFHDYLADQNSGRWSRQATAHRPE